MKDDDFSRTHPAFLWAMRASHQWNLVKGIIPSMKSTVHNNELEISRLINQRGTVTQNDHDTSLSFDTIFKHFFCITAQNLADELRMPLTGLGELYHQVLDTVTQVSRFEMISRTLPRLGKGQLMFTVRQLDEQQTAKFMANGYRFAPIERVTEILSRRIHLPPTDLAVHLHEMREYINGDRGYPAGVHLVAFALRPTLREHFEILTRAGGSMDLPRSTLPISLLTKADLELLNSMDGCGFTACLKQLQPIRGARVIGAGGRRAGSGSTGSVSVSSIDSLATADGEESSFATHLYRAMLELMATLPENIASAARFSAKPLLAPCHRQSPSDPEHCVLICFRVVSALDTRLTDANLTFTPLRLFRLQAQVNDKIGERERFVRELNSEFASYSAQSTTNNSSKEADGGNLRLKRSETVASIPNKIWSRLNPVPIIERKIPFPKRLQRATSQESLVHTSHKQIHQSNTHKSGMQSSTTRLSPPRAPAGNNAFNPFLNEILVSKEVTVDVARIDEVEMTNISTEHASTSPPRRNKEDAASDFEVDGKNSRGPGAMTGADRQIIIEGGLSRFGATYVDELYGLCLGREIRMNPESKPRDDRLG